MRIAGVGLFLPPQVYYIRVRPDQPILDTTGACHGRRT